LVRIPFTLEAVVQPRENRFSLEMPANCFSHASLTFKCRQFD
jgi:hypothetical protein